MPTVYNIGAESYASVGGQYRQDGSFLGPSSVPVGTAFSPTLQIGLGNSTGITSTGK
jgi:hypothetical protein